MARYSKIHILPTSSLLELNMSEYTHTFSQLNFYLKGPNNYSCSPALLKLEMSLRIAMRLLIFLVLSENHYMFLHHQTLLL